MIVVKVELHSAITRKVTLLAKMHITNDGTGTMSKRNYDVATMRGRDEDALSRNTVQKQARVEDWPSERLHVWNLVQRALSAMGYGA